MKFHDQVVGFDFSNIPVVGNLNNGHLIGLTEDGRKVCQRAFSEEISMEDLESVDEKLSKALIEGGYFESQNRGDELQSAYLHVTQRCNFDCVGCYSYNEYRNKQSDATTSQMQTAVRELVKNGTQSIVVSGGEPFLRNDLKDILKYAKQECNVKNLSVLSNGSLITDEALEAIAPWVDMISVSFDGYSPDCIPYVRKKQYYKILVEAVNRIKKAGINGHIIPTIHAKNYRDIGKYMELANELGVTINFSLLICTSDDIDLGDLVPSDEDLVTMGTELFMHGKKNDGILRDSSISTNLSTRQSCGAGIQLVSVAADGTVYPCHMMHESGLSMGNIFQTSLQEILNSSVALTCANLKVEEFNGCEACEYMYLCGGGCRARSLFSGGDLFSKDSLCLMARQFYERYGRELHSALNSREGGE